MVKVYHTIKKSMSRFISKSSLLYRAYLWYVDRALFFIQYWADYRFCLRYAMPMNEKKRGYKYRVLMISHFLEKGMGYADLRPFGIGHVSNMMRLLSCFDDEEHNCFEYHVGLDSLQKWAQVFRENHWIDVPLLEKVEQFLQDKHCNNGLVGIRRVQCSDTLLPQEASYENLFRKQELLNRCSIRDFSSQPLTTNDIDFSLKCFQSSPSACNRQPCKIYLIRNKSKIALMHQRVPGVGGLNKKCLNYFFVTYDTAAIVGAKERNQGFLNAGLAAMNFVNGLHLSGLASCMLQWDLREKEDLRVRKALGVPESERIAVVIAVGHKPTEYIVAKSARKPIKDLFTELD